ncbi:ImmA/IrrE family metallo-endopeptidase [Lactococcus lactis]|uniref:IrrE N-terminal-like domain-containing protein n=1 Tax=Lactococcus lactis TaxID=1358 RepID=A0AAP8E1X9_9LACT|nr:ImmA/IrrE family metallo-endopeptidase [Lactococcus lactis]MDG4970478.1 ImmA/IrrE family metallo-endopeptidase [Lactococcus lactis]PFG89209.1 hypothetical protein BW154_06965 [Lactococcus lactis]
MNTQQYEYIKYVDIYRKEFLSNFSIFAEEISQLELSMGKPAIDLKSIADIIKIKIEYAPDIDDSGEYNRDENRIIINSLEPKNRQRFTIAHELGHAVLGHPGISKRTESYADLLQKSRETLANKFASELLMPRTLIVKVMSVIITEQGWNQSSLTDGQTDFLVENSAEKLEVSYSALKFAVENNNIFIRE